MKVILQQDVRGQGKKGQLVEVSDGYARNFLLPKKLAVIATAENLNTMKLQEKARKAQEAAEKAEAQALAAQHRINIAKTKLVLDEPIKACGGYQIKAKLGYEITGIVKVMVAEEG